MNQASASDHPAASQAYVTVIPELDQVAMDALKEEIRAQVREAVADGLRAGPGWLARLVRRRWH